MRPTFIKIVTSNDEARWINLDRVTRISLAKDTNSAEQMLVFMFDGNDRVAIHGSDDVNRDLIRRLLVQLGQFAVPVSQAA